MPRNFYLFMLAAFLLASCTKKNNTTVNNNTYVDNALPAFAVYGIQDIVFTNGFSSSFSMPLSVQYLDSAQQRVSLSVGGLPAGVFIDTNWVQNGVPTYSTTLTVYDTTSYVSPGVYPLTLTATPDSGSQKIFKFNLTVRPLPAVVLGRYGNCRNYCDTVATYADSVYADAAVPGKVWFINFADSHNLVYGFIRNGSVIIPQQTVGGQTFNATGDIYLNHHINMSFGSSCAMDMF